MQIDQANIPAGTGVANYIHEGGPLISGTGAEDDFKSRLDAMEVSASGSVFLSDATYLRPGQEQEKKTAADMLDGETGQSAQERRNQMAVLANTTSTEDLAKMQEDGYSLSDMDSRTILTVTDKIKAQLAKAGVDVSIYGDTISREELEEITGSEAVAAQIAQELKRNDLPLTDENLEDCAKAYEKARSISELDEGAARYLIKNELPPTIENLYRAQYSSTEAAELSQNAGKKISDADFDAMAEQIERIITEAGLEADQETMDESRWLIQNGLLLTSENLAYLDRLQHFSGQGTEEIVSAMAEAVAEGKRPMDGMLIEGYSLMDQAEAAAEIIAEASDEDLVYLIDHEKDLTIENLRTAREYRTSGGTAVVLDETDAAVLENYRAEQEVSARGLALLTAKRQLEETRLAMSAEANYALLKKGISIDTKPLVELVEALKNQEDRYYRDLMQQSGVDSGEEKVLAFARTTQVITDLKGYPANILTLEDTEDTLQSLHESGSLLKETYTKANQRYETLMTAPRADMGDSIQKAFRNVDDILIDLDLNTTEANRRAVRILAYNQTEITAETVTLMKAKDEEVQRAFANMTPQVTMEMIRRNMNPLDMELSRLNEAAETIKSEIGAGEEERFSKYLWKLEQNQEITEEERSSYIGIYRLIAQVEKTDGAVIGSLINQGADLTMRNLLSAVRTEKKGSMDYQVDDAFAGADSAAKGPRIDDQIMAAFQQNCIRDTLEGITPSAFSKVMEQGWEDMMPEQLKEALQQAAVGDETDAELEAAYLDGQLSEFTDVLESPEEVYAFLERNDLPNTIGNILAVNQMMSNPNQMFETLFQPKNASSDRIRAVEEMKQIVLERFGEAVKTPEELAEAQETLAEVAEHAMDNMIIEQDSVSTLDIRALRLAAQQFAICAKQTKEECYMIPMQTGDGVTGVSLKIIRGEEKKGFVDILFRTNHMGKVAASFEAKGNGISGMIAADEEETRQFLLSQVDRLADMLNENGGETVDLRVAYIPELSLAHYGAAQETRSETLRTAAPEETKDPVQTTRLYHIAESFLQLIGELA